MQTTLEPYTSRVVEPMRMTTREARERFIREAGYTPFLLNAEQVLIDLVTDSGVSALSARQWSAMRGSDESFTGPRSVYRFRETVRARVGHALVIPCHQGGRPSTCSRAPRVLLRDVTDARSDEHGSTTEGESASGEGADAQLVNHARASASVAQALVRFAPDAARNPCRSMLFRPVMPMTAWRAFLLE